MRASCWTKLIFISMIFDKVPFTRWHWSLTLTILSWFLRPLSQIMVGFCTRRAGAGAPCCFSLSITILVSCDTSRITSYALLFSFVISCNSSLTFIIPSLADMWEFFQSYFISSSLRFIFSRISVRVLFSLPTELAIEGCNFPSNRATASGNSG